MRTTDCRVVRSGAMFVTKLLRLPKSVIPCAEINRRALSMVYRDHHDAESRRNILSTGPTCFESKNRRYSRKSRIAARCLLQSLCLAPQPTRSIHQSIDRANVATSSTTCSTDQNILQQPRVP